METSRVETVAMEENTETDMASQPQSSSILGDRLGLLADNSTSMKRDAADMEGGTQKESNKRRRSSLSTYRRSITGDIKPQFDTESSSQTSGSQDSTSTEKIQSSQSSTADGNWLLPNLKNLQLDAIIKEARAKVKVLDDECAAWNKLLKEFEEKEEQAKQQALDLILSANDIPDEWKTEAMAKYITRKPLDLQALKRYRFNLIFQYQFDMEACMQDLKLVKETFETIKRSNQHLALQLSNAMEENTRSLSGDAKQLLHDFLTYI